MRIGFSEIVITPQLGVEMVGYLPSRLADSIEKDLKLKIVTIENHNKLSTWLTVDMLGLDVFFKKMVLKTLKIEGIILEDLLMFSTHTHSGPTCVSEDQYYGRSKGGLLSANDDADLNNEIFDFLVSQAVTAIKESILDLNDFTYKIARGQMKDFQTNRINKDFYSFDDILTIEVSKENKKYLIYSFSGHPTILNSASTLISPDYVGEVSKNLETVYDFSIFFNAPCGDMSTRYTKSESSINELIRLGKVASDHIFNTLKTLSEARTLENYKVEYTTYPLQFKEFKTLEDAERAYDESKEEYAKAQEANADDLTLRALRASLEGHMVNLYHSQQNYTGSEYKMDIAIVTLDDLKVINLESEVFSSLIEPLVNENIWVNSLYNQFSTYLSDIRGFELNTYEALSSLYKPGEGEKLIEFLKTK